ncbi:unnamed protein product [Mesocestoides corti]|uniref:CAP-ZIP_m domain-containing protein n=1 Tax=Mesocestoides corti TaxID=53468 RepID=A0A0R3UN24_MESCO|nr:unnamed protein product [Mesocestoides corti]
MPRRSSGNTENPAPRRQSARIAAAVANKPTTPSPVKKTPRRAVKRTSADHSANENAELNGTEDSSRDASSVEQTSEKRQKIDGDEECVENPQSNEQEKSASGIDSKLDDTKSEATKEVAQESTKNPLESEHQTATDEGFEVVEKSDVPQPDSDDVKSAIAAQGEDGQLLVNFVQVSKDDLPPAVPENSSVGAAEKPPTNGTEPCELGKGDIGAGDVVVEEPAHLESEQKKEGTPTGQPPETAVSH